MPSKVRFGVITDSESRFGVVLLDLSQQKARSSKVNHNEVNLLHLGASPCGLLCL